MCSEDEVALLRPVTSAWGGSAVCFQSEEREHCFSGSDHHDRCSVPLRL